LSREVDNYVVALRPVRDLYGDTPARSFGPLGLRASRDAMVKAGVARTTINDRVGRIRRVFKWAASMEMIPASVPESLRTVDGLRAGRTGAREAEPVGPVPVETVEATLPHLPAAVAAMVRLQLLTGMRAGEVQIMRGTDLKADGPVWEYRPRRHKNLWRGRERIIPLGPRAQAIIRGFLEPDPTAYLFVGVRPDGTVGDYQRGSYRQAVVRGCDRAFPHPTLAAVPPGRRTDTQNAELAAWRKAHRWHPLQLRHTAATAIRARYGLETAQVVLGHAKADVTQVYAERDFTKAVEVMREVG
jgi:integrase